MLRLQLLLCSCSRLTAGNRCPDPGVPPGSLRSGDYFEYEDEVTYSCSNSMYLVGSRVRTCQADGQWSGTEPSCFCKQALSVCYRPERVWYVGMSCDNNDRKWHYAFVLQIDIRMTLHRISMKRLGEQ